MSSGSPFATTINSFAPSVFLAGRDCLTDVTVPKGCSLQSGAALAGQAERGVITDMAGNLAWSGNRARLGQYYTAWLTGMGTIAPGSVAASFPYAPAYGYPNPEPGILNVTYAGAVPQFPGLYQVNFQVPLNVGQGPSRYGAWPCGNYDWELELAIGEGRWIESQGTDPVSIPLSIRTGDVSCQ